MVKKIFSFFVIFLGIHSTVPLNHIKNSFDQFWHKSRAHRFKAMISINANPQRSAAGDRTAKMKNLTINAFLPLHRRSVLRRTAMPVARRCGEKFFTADEPRFAAPQCDAADAKRS